MGWNFVAGEFESVCQDTVQDFEDGVKEVLRLSIFSPAAMAENAVLQSASTASTILSSGLLISSEKSTLPGTVFVLPGFKVRIPVDASAPLREAARWE